MVRGEISLITPDDLDKPEMRDFKRRVLGCEVGEDFNPGDNVLAIEDIHNEEPEGPYLAVQLGQRGTVREVNEGGPEGHWLHVIWQAGGRRYPHNVYPSQVGRLPPTPQ